MARRRQQEIEAPDDDAYTAFRDSWINRYRSMNPLASDEACERFVRAMVAGRSGWAPADDWSVIGPHAAPPEIVAQHRAGFRRQDA